MCALLGIQDASRTSQHVTCTHGCLAVATGFAFDSATRRAVLPCMARQAYLPASVSVGTACQINCASRKLNLHGRRG